MVNPPLGLQRSYTRLARLIMNLEGGVLVEDETRHITLVNQAFCTMFSIPAPPEALIGTDCSNSAEAGKHLFSDPDGFVRRIDVLLLERQAVSGELIHLCDGRVFSRDYTPVFEGDDYIGHLWHYRDVTEFHRGQQRLERLLQSEGINKEINRLFLQLDDADEALNRSLALTGQLLDVSRVYVFRIREHERILDNTHEWCAPGVSPELDNLKGLPLDDLFPSLFPMLAELDLIAPRHINELPDDLRGVLEPQDIQTVLWIPLYLHNRIEGFLGYDETRQGRIWLPEEITMARIVTEGYARTLERKQAERALVKTRDEAVRTAQLRAQFVANMSHEIRTPMTGTLGMLELLLETELTDLQQEFATESYNSASRLLALINDILDFSKLEAGQVVLEATPIDLKAIATEVRMTLAPQVRGKPVELRIDFDPDTPYRVFGDATRLRQVLMNLVGNAVKFTHEGSVVLAVKAVRADTEVSYLRFTVRDTGIGIAPESIRHIFDSFVQADGSTTRKYGGSGLGLSISQQLVSLMGGTIEVESQPEGGSTFSFALRLPVAQAAGVDKTANSAFVHLNVLLIDDNRTARYVLAQQLEAWGVAVTQADDIAALEQMRPDRLFDVVFQRCPAERGTLAAPASRYGRRQINIREGECHSPQTCAVCLQWPLDQSTLYNLLVTSVPEPAVTADEPLKGRVLLADDYPANVGLVKRALAGMHIQVDFVENGENALHQLAQASYDLVLMDMHMPVMDGVEATRRIRQSTAPYSTVPVLALTASVMPEQRERYLEAGVDAIISKPFSVKHLREMVLHWLTQTPALTPDPDA